ncbi:MAG TPA: CHAT domain-containing protein [Streptosporangiaceae bacterium]
MLWQVPAADPVQNFEDVIAAYQGALQTYSPDVCPVEYGMVQNNLGNAYRKRRQGDIGENIEWAIRSYLAALSVRTRESHLYYWARTQNNLGGAYADRQQGNRSDNEKLAIAAYRAALEIHTVQSYPGDYAMDQTNLGLIYLEGADGKTAGLDQAMICFMSALLVYVADRYPSRYRMLIDMLGNSFRARWELTPEDRREALAIDLRLAIEELLHAQTRSGTPIGVEFPKITFEGVQASREADLQGVCHWLPAPCLLSGYMRDWYFSMPLQELMEHLLATDNAPQRIELLRAAVTRDDVVLPSFRADLLDQLGVDLLSADSVDQAEDQEEAINALQTALKALCEQEDPDRWSTIQCHLANAFAERTSGDRADNFERAIEHCTNAVKASSAPATGSDRIRPAPGREASWVTNVGLLGQLYRDRRLGDQHENYRRAIGAFEATEAVWARTTHPYEWARVQNSLGMVHLGARPDAAERGNPEASHLAADAFRRALGIITKERYPDEWAGITTNLAMALTVPTDADDKDREKAIGLLIDTLSVRTKERFPREWARVQHNLGQAYHQGTSAGPDVDLKAAAKYFSAALEVLTLVDTPADHRSTVGALGSVHARLGDWEAAHRAFASAAAATEIMLSTVSTGAHGFDEVAKRGHEVGELDCFALCRLARFEEAVAALEHGRAAWLAKSVGLREADPTRIADPDRRRRYVEARDRLWVAQEAVNELRWSGPETRDGSTERAGLAAAPGPGKEAIARTEALQAARANFDELMAEIESHCDPVGFRAADLTAAKIADGINHPLVYLLTTEWGGLAVAVLGTRARPGMTPQLAVLSLPDLTDEFIDDLVQVTLPDGTGRTVGGFGSAQEGIGLNWLVNQWEGKNLAEKAASLQAACSAVGLRSTLAASAAHLLGLTCPGLPELLRHPIEELSEADVSRLMATVDHELLNAEVQRCLQKLGKAMEPLTGWLLEQEVTEVTFVPCGLLAAFPLLSVPLPLARAGSVQAPGAALSTGRATLSDRFVATVAPSARSIIGKDRSSQPRSGVYSIGDPRPTHQVLRWGEAEALSVARLGGDASRARTGEAATREWLLDSLANGEMVSASCHGQFESRDFLRSRLLLADGATLTLADAFGQGVNLSGLPLLVMSACQSAVLDLRGARGEVRSLAAGMLQAGARAVMGSLWAVDDRATYLLMVRFAQEWLPVRSEESPAAALARAQAWLRTVTNRELAAWEATAGSGRSDSPAGLIAVRGRGDRYAIAEAEQVITGLARRGHDPDDTPYASPIFWAAFQIWGQVMPG